LTVLSPGRPSEGTLVHHAPDLTTSEGLEASKALISAAYGRYKAQQRYCSYFIGNLLCIAKRNLSASQYKVYLKDVGETTGISGKVLAKQRLYATVCNKYPIVYFAECAPSSVTQGVAAVYRALRGDTRIKAYLDIHTEADQVKLVSILGWH
jgi:hypothetical protein